MDVEKDEKGKLECYLDGESERCGYFTHIVICISLILKTIFLSFCQLHFSNSEIDVVKEERGKVECYLVPNRDVCIF